MRKLIHRYLSAYYVVNGKSILRIGKKFAIYQPILVDELTLIFGLSRKEFKWYIKNWARKQSKGFDFNHWWKDCINPLEFPTIRNVTSRLIAADLVDVRPMGEPTGLLTVVDWFHPDNDVLVGEYTRPNRNQRSYLTELQRVVDDMTTLDFPFIYE